MSWTPMDSKFYIIQISNAWFQLICTYITYAGYQDTEKECDCKAFSKNVGKKK